MFTDRWSWSLIADRWSLMRESSACLPVSPLSSLLQFSSTYHNPSHDSQLAFRQPPLFFNCSHYSLFLVSFLSSPCTNVPTSFSFFLFFFCFLRLFLQQIRKRKWKKSSCGVASSTNSKEVGFRCFSFVYLKKGCSLFYYNNHNIQFFCKYLYLSFHALFCFPKITKFDVAKEERWLISKKNSYKKSNIARDIYLKNNRAFIDPKKNLCSRFV